MWSLYKKKKSVKEDTEQVSPSEESPSFEDEGDKLNPLQFSNGKTQADIVKEILDEIKKGTKIIFIKGVCGTGKCLDKDTLIFCKKKNSKYFNYQKISELVNQEGTILTLDNQGKIVESRFFNVRETGIKKIYKLRTRTGREIKASANHPFLTITEKGIEWHPLEKLTNNSYICLPSMIEIKETQDLDDNKIKILAHLIAEGKLGDKAGSPKYYQERESEVRKDYEQALKETFPEGELKSSEPFEVTMIFKNMDTRFGTTNKLRLFVREFGLDGKKSKDKFIPPQIFNLNREKTALFLRILFSCDGTIYKKDSGKKNKQTIIEYDSISRQLIYGVSILLSRFGIQHTITTHQFKTNPEYNYRISISNQEQLRIFIENIGFIGKKQKIANETLPLLKFHKFTNLDKVPRVIRDYLKNNGFSYNQLDRFLNFKEIEKLRENIGFKKIRKLNLVKSPCVFKQGKIDFLRSHLKEVNKYIQDSILSFICNESIIWDKVKSISPINEDVTYDLEVEKYHNFIANGMIVHNSAIALNLARQFKKSSIVVPIKSLQEQYEEDYANTKFILKGDKSKLKISVIKGRANFECPFIGGNADADDLPCKIEIRDKNREKIMDYIQQNSDVTKTDFSSLEDVRRMSVAPACPYWSPLLPADIKSKSLEKSEKLKYQAISGKEYCLYKRQKGCGYYEQYSAYSNADVLIFNSQKYILETALGRKPKTELDVVDECDEFLDSFANERSINLNRLVSALSNLTNESQEKRQIIKDLIFSINNILFGRVEIEVEKIFNTDFIKIIEKIIDNPYLAEDEEDNYYNRVFEIAKEFEPFLEETYVSISKKKYFKQDSNQEKQSPLFNQDNSLSNLFGRKQDNEQTYLTLVTINLAKRFEELLKSTQNLVLMSGTLHSEQVLKDIFGLKDFKIIEAEVKNPGTIVKYRTGLEKNCKYENFKYGLVSRQSYLKALSCCIENSQKPTLVHVNSFDDLPSELEKEEFGLHNLISKDKLKELQEKPKEAIQNFKEGKSDVLFTTKCSRGIDFPGKTCQSIIITRYPYPNIQELFWKILRKERPNEYLEFYLDKARRDLVQKIARGVRFKGDHVILLSPDSRVLEADIR